MIFDWYAATIRPPVPVVPAAEVVGRYSVAVRPVVPAAEVVGTVAAGLGGVCVSMGKGLHGYTESYEIRRPGAGVVARALMGGTNPWPHVWASGGHTQGLVDVVRRVWPEEHTVSRIDTAEDFGGAHCWDDLLAVCVEQAEGSRLSINQAGDWLRDGEAGRTLYLGSKASPVRARLYEKGKQLRGDGIKDAPLDWVRLELQVRPEHQAKWTMAKCDPEQVWGASRWSKALASSALDLDVGRVDGRVWHEDDDVRALRYLVRQYGPLLRRMRDHLGFWDDVGNTLGNLCDPVGDEPLRAC